MSERHYVIGGAYLDTRWTELIAGTAELHGPFDNVETAEQVWRGRAFATVDYAHIRFQVVSEAELPSFLGKVGDGRVACGRELIERLIALANRGAGIG